MSNRMIRSACVLGVALALSLSLSAQDKKPPKEDSGHGKAFEAKGAAAEGLERLKQLAGDWVYVEPQEGAPADAVAFNYRVAGGGSTVIETIMPGTEHEMVTVYYAEGDDLVLVHYCALGNQPKMKATNPGDKNKIEFKFAGGSNIDPAKSMHMHEMTMTFESKDRITADWVMYQDGKRGDHGMPFKLKRKGT